MNSFSVVIAGIVVVVITMLFVSFFPKCCKVGSNKNVEGFEGDSCLKPELFNTCPLNSKTFQDESGATLCCQGDVHGHTCDGKVLCSFAPNKKDIPHCVPFVRNLLEESEQYFCPSRIPKLYVNTSISQLNGCVKGLITSTFDAPVNANDKTCSFSDQTEKGCGAMRAYEDSVCPRMPCMFNETSEQINGVNISYLVVSYKDKNNRQTLCVDDKSFFDSSFTNKYTGAVEPRNFCSVQKKIMKGMKPEKAIREFIDPRKVSEDPSSALKNLAESMGGLDKLNNSQLKQVCFNIR